jgi:hypothetical protein
MIRVEVGKRLPKLVLRGAPRGHGIGVQALDAATGLRSQRALLPHCVVNKQKKQTESAPPQPRRVRGERFMRSGSAGRQSRVS